MHLVFCKKKHTYFYDTKHDSDASLPYVSLDLPELIHDPIPNQIMMGI